MFHKQSRDALTEIGRYVIRYPTSPPATSVGGVGGGGTNIALQIRLYSYVINIVITTQTTHT